MKRLAFIFACALSLFAFAEEERVMFGELSFKDGSTSGCLVVFRTSTEENSFFCEIRRRIDSRIRSQVFRGVMKGTSFQAKSGDGRLQLYGVMGENEFNAGILDGEELLYSLSAKDGSKLIDEDASINNDGGTSGEAPPEPPKKFETPAEEIKPDLANVRIYAYKGKLSGKEGEKDAELKASFSNGRNNNMNIVVMVARLPESVSAEFYSGVADKGRFTAISRGKSKIISGRFDSKKLEAEIKEEGSDEASFFSGER
jgi:hypothetical protein